MNICLYILYTFVVLKFYFCTCETLPIFFSLLILTNKTCCLSRTISMKKQKEKKYYLLGNISVNTDGFFLCCCWAWVLGFEPEKIIGNFSTTAPLWIVCTNRLEKLQYFECFLRIYFFLIFKKRVV